MKTRIIVSLIAIVFLWSCATTMKYTWTKENYKGKKFNKVLVIVHSQTAQGRIAGENAIVEELKKEGINATNSLTVFPQMANKGSLSEDEIEAKIIDNDYDGVLVTSLVDANTKEVREGGEIYPQPVTYRYGRRIRSGYVHMQEPEYYRQETTYLFETQLFDASDKANRKEVVWSGQSKLIDPVSAESAASSYSKTLVKTLVESGLMK